MPGKKDRIVCCFDFFCDNVAGGFISEDKIAREKSVKR
jgi:hypothetical protein